MGGFRNGPYANAHTQRGCASTPVALSAIRESSLGGGRLQNDRRRELLNVRQHEIAPLGGLSVVEAWEGCEGNVAHVLDALPGSLEEAVCLTYVP